jgi:hypothetical protein
MKMCRCLDADMEVQGSRVLCCLDAGAEGKRCRGRGRYRYRYRCRGAEMHRCTGAQVPGAQIHRLLTQSL